MRGSPGWEPKSALPLWLLPAFDLGLYCLVMSTNTATNFPAASEPTGNEDLTLSQIVPKAPGSPKKGSLIRKYGGLPKDDLRGNGVRKEQQKVRMSKLRFDHNLFHGQTRT